MKITLNTTIPESRRPEVEALVKSHAGESVIVWLPSRFPRFVMLVEPGDVGAGPPSDSIFDSPSEETESAPALAEQLEQVIKALLAQG